MASFADFLVENFFVSLKTWPNPPLYAFGSYGWHSVPQRSQYEECLYRDGHRCIISGKFDFHGYNHRVRDYDESTDDDGVALPEDEEEWEDQVEKLCFAHVVPWWIGGKRKQTAYGILRRFNPEAIESIAKPDAIDQPCNGVTLHQFVVSRFYGFEIGFEPVEDDAPHTYKIDTHDPLRSCSDFPVTRTLCARDGIELPSPKLLSVHFALGKILYLSGVGRYIDSLVRDIQRLKAPQDVFAPWNGSMRLDVYVRLKLGDDSYLADTD